MSLQFRDLKRQYKAIKTYIDSGINSVIESASFIGGKQVEELELLLADYVGTKHCISCGNGTDAITISLMALLEDMDADEWKNCAVFVPDFTFFSSGECPASLGLPTYFVDVKSGTYNINPSELRSCIERVQAEGRHKPFAVIAVDLFGQPAEYEELIHICKKYGIFLLEDGAQGFGGHIFSSEGKKMACSFGDISTTSFFPAKPLGCYGDGGAIFTDEDHLADRCRSIAVHGKDISDLKDPLAKYNNIRFGMNSRLDTMQAAILHAKFSTFKNSELVALNRLASQYTEQLSSVEGLALPIILPGYYSSWAQYTVQLPIKTDRGKIQESLKAAGIPTMIYYKKPMHKQKAFVGTVGADSICPMAEKLCESVLCLPIHPYLEQNEVDMVCTELEKALFK